MFLNISRVRGWQEDEGLLGEKKNPRKLNYWAHGLHYGKKQDTAAIQMSTK